MEKVEVLIVRCHSHASPTSSCNPHNSFSWMLRQNYNHWSYLQRRTASGWLEKLRCKFHYHNWQFNCVFRRRLLKWIKRNRLWLQLLSWHWLQINCTCTEVYSNNHCKSPRSLRCPSNYQAFEACICFKKANKKSSSIRNAHISSRMHFYQEIRKSRSAKLIR